MNTSPKELFTLPRLSVKDCSGIVEQEIINDVSVAEDFSELIYLPIQLVNCPTIINGLYDSGSELTVLADEVIPQQHLQRVGRVKLRGIFGDSVDADLVLLKMRLADSTQDNKYLNIHCAVCDGINDSLILTADVVRKLTQLHNSDNIQDHDFIKSLQQPAHARNSDKIDRPTTSKVLHAVQPAQDPGGGH